MKNTLFVLVLVLVAACQPLTPVAEVVSTSTPIPRLTASPESTTTITPTLSPTPLPGDISLTLSRFIGEDGEWWYKLVVSSVMKTEVSFFINNKELGLYDMYYYEDYAEYIYQYSEGDGSVYVGANNFFFEELAPSSSIKFFLSEDSIPLAFINAYGWSFNFNGEGEEEVEAWQVVSEARYDLLLSYMDSRGSSTPLTPEIDEIDRGIRNQVFYLDDDLLDQVSAVIIKIDRGQWGIYEAYIPTENWPERVSDEQAEFLSHDQILKRVHRFIYLAEFLPESLP